jgi:hypothetical protein
MTAGEVTARFGAPDRVRWAGEWTYLFYSDGCDPACGSDDVVYLRNERVVSAVLRAASRRLSATSAVLATTEATDPAAGAAPTSNTDREGNRRMLHAVRIAGASPVIDGRLDEEIWSRAEVADDFVQLRPESGARASEKTEARILFGEQAIYIGVRLHDSRPDSIVARLGRRDESLYSDWVSVQLDSNRDHRTAFTFAINPRGVKRDALLYDDTHSDGSWNAVWDGAASIDASGWTAEFRIPLSQLRFSLPRDSSTEMRWGVNIDRHLARRDEVSSWALIPRNAGRQVSLFGELRGLEGLRPPRRLEILPYSVARLTRAPGEATDPFYERNELFHSFGADVSYGVTSNLTLTATLNPDFGQVEADPSVVNLTAYETFFPEQRPFFVEGREILRLGVGDAQLFYSRRIGRAPQRDVSPAQGSADVPPTTTVLGAAKLSGRTAKGWSVGVLQALTAREEARVVDSIGVAGVVLVEPLTNYSVARVTRDLGRGQSTLGGIFTATNRWLEPGDGLDFLRSAAYAGGVDVRLRAGDYEVAGSVLGSRVEGAPEAIARTQRAAGRYFQRPDAMHLRFDPERTSLSGHSANLSFSKVGGGHWTWGASGHAISPGFEVNDLGFQRGADVVSQNFFVSYHGYDPGTVFRDWNLTLNEWARWNWGGERLATGLGADLGFQLHSYWGWNLGVNRAFPALSTDALWGGPALMAPARTDVWFGLYGDSRQTLNLQLFGNAGLEDETGGHSLGLGAALNLRPSSRLDLALTPYLGRNTDALQYLAEQSFEGAPYYLFGRLDQTTASLTARLNLTFTPNLSLQYSAAPFVSAGEYSQFKVVREPRARRFAARFHTFAPDEVGYDAEGHSYLLDLNGDGDFDGWLWNPEFNSKALNSNLVLRWEYRRGSTLFVVWSHGRWEYLQEGSFRMERDFGRLLGVRPDDYRLPATNVLMVKLNYWLGM